MAELSLFDKSLIAHNLARMNDFKLPSLDLQLFVSNKGELQRFQLHTEFEFDCKPDIIPIEIMSHQLAFWQKEILLDTLRKDAGATAEADITATICSKTNLETNIVEAYVKSYRFNNNQGAIARLTQAVDSERALAPKAEPKPIPTPRAATGTAPAADPNGGKVAQILALHDAGKSNNEIIALGYNKSTVYRQVSEYKARKAAEKK